MYFASRVILLLSHTQLFYRPLIPKIIYAFVHHLKSIAKRGNIVCSELLSKMLQRSQDYT